MTALGYVPGEAGFDTLTCTVGFESHRAKTSPMDTGNADWSAPTERSDS